MTDQELLALLAEKTPDELSLEEIDLLRERLGQSDALREALLSQVQMEGYLAAALGRVHVSPADIIARVRRQQASGMQISILLILLLVVVPTVGLAGAVLWNAIQPSVEVAEVTQSVPDPVQEPPQQASKNDKPAPSAVSEKGAATPEKNGEGQPKPEEKVSPVEKPSAVAVGQTPPAEVLTTVLKPPVPAAPATPWSEVLAREDLPTFSDEAFTEFATGKSLPRRVDLIGWFEPVPGQNYRITEVDTQRGRCGALEGSARMKAPWQADSALKFALENYNRLTIHLYHGQQGVTLVYYQEVGDRWAAYSTTRKAGGLRPETVAITSTDDDRAKRSELRFGGPLELRWHAGQVILSRGDIPLVSAPLAGLPDDVYFEGRATFLGLSLVRTRDTIPLAAPRANSYENAKPAELGWKSSKPEIAQPQPQPDGSLRFAVDKGKERVECFTPLPVSNLQEVILELENATPGSAVFLGNDKGVVQEVIRFQKNTRNGQLGVRLKGADDEAEFDLGIYPEKPAPLVNPHCFIRLVYGCGNIRWWVSSDGINWAQVEMAVDGALGNRSFIGLQLVANRPEVQITLKRITLRELSGLTALAPKAIRDQAVASPASPSLGHWLGEISRRRPADVDAAQWRRACAIRTLGAGTLREVAYALLDLLLDDASVEKLPIEAQLAALDDAMLLVWDLRDEQLMKTSVPRRYLQLGLKGFEEQAVRPWTAIRQRVMSVPVMTWLQSPITPEQNLRWELIAATHERQPQATLQLCRTLRFYQQQQFAPLTEWAEMQARRDLPGRAGGETASRLKDSWRHPLIEELSKDTYNSLRELQAVLESEAWEDAARMITSLDPEGVAGVAPYHRDKELLVSLPVAVRLAQADYPQLKTALGDKFGTLAKLRIGQAMAAGDAAAVELGSVQFAGTSAAAEAHQWLGDRALASGWFERSVAEYRRAESIQPSLAAEVAPRIRLAAAMLGQDVGQPATRSVRFGDVNMTKEQFEALVTEMRSRLGGGLSSASILASPKTMLPPATGLQATVKAKLDGPVGDKPQEEVGRRTNQFRVPWADRQIATVLEGDVLYVSNRFQVAAYNLASGTRIWQSVPPVGAVMARAQDWAMIPMQPVVTQSHIYTRLLYGKSPLLVCLDKGTGAIVWGAAQDDKEFLVSDPVIVQGQLCALAVALQEQQEGLLRWNTYDPLSGELLSQRDVVRLRNTWGARACCEVTTLEDSIVVVMGGVTLSLDASGRIRWIRRQVVLPADEEPRWVLQMYQRPLWDTGRLYIAQPGVRAVDCLDAASGGQIWSSVIPDIVAVIGLAGDKLVVRTETDVRALDKTTGKLVWRQNVADLHSFHLLGENGVLLAQREPVPAQAGQLQTRLTWLDVATGAILASAVPPNLTDPDPRWGPLVLYKDRLWTFFGRGQHDPLRDLVELAPLGEAEKPALALAASEALWLRHVPVNQQAAAAKFFPDWQLLSSAPGDRTGLMPEAHGEMNVLGLRSTAPIPVVFSRQFTIPAGGKPRLRIRVGNDPGQNWKLEVHLGDKVLHTVDITDATHPDRYKQLEIDLSPHVGQTGPLSVRAQFVSTGDATALFWKTLEVVF